MRREAAFAVALACLLARAASGALMSIDLGSEFLKVCLVKPGRTPISIAVNEMSKRKSPALVGVVNGERLLGEEAYSFAVRYPETIFLRARDLLGKDPDDPTIAAMLEEHDLPYKVVPHPKRGVASLAVGEQVYSAEELVGSILYYARQIAEAQAGGPVLDAVITVPAFFGQRQRQALADAAGLAGLNLMGLINTHTAAALQYGIERDFTNRSQTILLYDMGSGGTEVALVKYSTYTVKEAGKPKVYNQLEVRDVDWDESLGSNLLDMAMARHFAAEFASKSKTGVDVTEVPKAMSKLRRQVRRTKEMLSANSGAPFTVEELYDGRDFQSSITREAFEALADDFFVRATQPLKRVLQRNNLTPADIDAVELIGGGTRVPRLQAALSEVLGGRGLDRHLDADEAVALGAGLFAANLSTSFRLRKFGMVDSTMYSVALTLDHVVLGDPPEEGAGGAEDGGGALQRVRNLLPYMKKLPNKRVVKLEGLGSDPLRFSLAYNASTPHGLPPGVRSAELAEWEVSGIENVTKRYNTSGQVSLRFEADYSGLLRLAGVEATVEYEVMEEKIIEVPLNETEGGGAAGNATDAPAGADAADGAEGSAKADDKKASSGDDDGDGDGDGDSDGDGKGDDDAKGGEEEGASAEEGKEEEGKDEEGKEEDGGDGDSAEGEKEEDGKEEDAKDETKKEDGEKAEGKEEAGDAKPGNATEANATKPATTVRRILVPKRKIAKVPLNIGGRGWVSPLLLGEDLEVARSVLAKFVAAEAVKRDVAKSRNDIESYIIAMKESLETDELIQKVSTEEQRESFRARLTEEEDWLYMEADEGEGAQQFKDKLKQLKDIGEPIKNRAEELELRPRLTDMIKKQAELKSSIMKAWPDTKPWITDAERETLQKQLAEFAADFQAKLEAQSTKADHEDPAFTVSSVLAAWEKYDKAFNRVNNKKKPKPPPEPKPAANETDSAGTNKTEGAAGNGTSADSDSATGKQGSEPNAKDGTTGDAKAKQESAKGDKKDDPKAKKDDPKAKKEDPKAKKDDSKAKKDDPKAKKEEPKAKKEEPKAKKEEPKAKKEEPKAKKEEPKAKKEEPKAKKEEPKAKKEEPKAKKEEPKAKKEEPKAKKEDPKSKKEEPKAKKEDPKSKKEEPKAKKDTKEEQAKQEGKDGDKKGWSWNKKGKGEL